MDALSTVLLTIVAFSAVPLSSGKCLVHYLCTARVTYMTSCWVSELRKKADCLGGGELVQSPIRCDYMSGRSFNHALSTMILQCLILP